MRVLRIDTGLQVWEEHLDQDDWMTSDITWDAVELDSKHDIWVDDFGMLDPNGVYGIIAGRKIPLPAYVAGSHGEETVDATMEVTELEAMIGR